MLVSFLKGRGYRLLFQVKVKVGYTFWQEYDKAPIGCANFRVIFQKFSGTDMVKRVIIFKRLEEISAWLVNVYHFLLLLRNNALHKAKPI